MKDTRVQLPLSKGRPVGAWKRATQPSALIAMKTPSSWVYGVAGGTGALWEVLLSWPQFVLAPDPPSGPREVGCKMDTRWRRNNRDVEQREEGASWLVGVRCSSELHKITPDNTLHVLHLKPTLNLRLCYTFLFNSEKQQPQRSAKVSLYIGKLLDDKPF